MEKFGAMRALSALIALAAAVLLGYWLGSEVPPNHPPLRAEARETAGVSPIDRLPATSADDGSAAALAAMRARCEELQRECETLRAERDPVRRSLGSGAGGAPEAASSECTDLERRKEWLLRSWNRIFGEPALGFEPADPRQRGVFAEFFADLRRERTPEEIRRLYAAFLVGYLPYERARNEFDERTRYIRDAVELRGAADNLREFREAIYRHVIPLLDEDERRAIEEPTDANRGAPD